MHANVFNDILSTFMLVCKLYEESIPWIFMYDNHKEGSPIYVNFFKIVKGNVGFLGVKRIYDVNQVRTSKERLQPRA